MNILIAAADRQLRGSLSPGNTIGTAWQLPCILITIFGTLYGLTMGSFAGIGPERWLHLSYTAIKVPLLLGAAFIISWPSFAVANYLLGLGSDLKACFRILVSCQCIVAISLASLAPFTALWYFTVREYKLALLCNAVMYLLASVAGQYSMRRAYRKLARRDARHSIMLWVWIGIYSFVGIQLAWVLRPFVGSPAETIQFVRTEQLSNAYVWIAELLWSAIAGT